MTSTFWGLRLEPGKRYSTTVDKSFHVSMAALDCATVKNEKDIHCVMLEEGESSIPFILCNLNKPKILQSRLNLNFESGDRITFFCRGSGVVHLTGYIIPDDDDLAQFGEDGEEVEEEEEEAEEEEEDEEEDEKDVSDKMSKLNGMAGKRKAEAAAGLAAKKKKKGIVEDSGEESDEDENDEEDEDESADSDEEMEAESDDESELETPEEKKASPPAVNQEQQQGKKKNKKNKQASQGQQSPSPGQQQQQQGKQNKTALNGAQQKTPPPPQQQQQKKKQQQQQTGNEKPQGKKITLEGGVSVTDLKVGNGPICKPGKMATVYYTGRLKSNNKVFDQTSSGPGFKFRVGRGEVIKGWDVGLAGMKVGGKRLITCPPNMGYGQKGMPPTIPGNSTLMFEVELKGVN